MFVLCVNVHRQCCQQTYHDIIHSPMIHSKIWNIFNESTPPYNHPEWQLIDQFCNTTKMVVNDQCNAQAMADHMLFDFTPLTLPIYGYVSPCLGIFTLITNILICVVLLKKHMRNPTNILLVAMAISDLLTGVIPIPVFLHSYTFGNYEEWSSCAYSITRKYVFLNLPTVCHTASIWLTVALAVHRYLCVCHNQRAKEWCNIPNMLKVICVIYVMAFLAQLCKFIDETYETIHLPSIIEPWKMVYGCRVANAQFVQNHVDAFYQSYWWFRVLCIHLIPCVSLVILNAFLICTMRNAQSKRQTLLRQNRQNDIKRMKETNSTTFMLVSVVGVFLLVEFPLAILMILYILQSSFYPHYLQLNTVFQMASLIINLCILLSYPFNFFIYCGMSRQFRETFKRLFAPGRMMPTSTDDYQTVATENGNNKNCVTLESNF